jgi:hypothetical protein
VATWATDDPPPPLEKQADSVTSAVAEMAMISRFM